MSKLLIIKDADFSANSLGMIGNYLQLPLIVSSKNVRATKYKETFGGNFTLYSSTNNTNTWYTYIADVSEYVGKICKVKANNGYGASILGNGAFMDSNFPSLQSGFTAPTSGTSYENNVVQLICKVSEENSNKDVYYEYVIPDNAKWLVFTSKSNGEVLIDESS